MAPFLEDHDPLPRNAAVVLDATGKVILHYAKVHTCAFDLPEAALTPARRSPWATWSHRPDPFGSA